MVWDMSRIMTKTTKLVCTQRRLRSAWAFAQSYQSSLRAQWVAKDTSFLHADSEVSDQTGRMTRLIWVFAGRTAILLVLSCIKPSISPKESSINQAPYRTMVLTICSGWKKNGMHGVIPVFDVRHAFRALLKMSWFLRFLSEFFTLSAMKCFTNDLL